MRRLLIRHLLLFGLALFYAIVVLMLYRKAGNDRRVATKTTTTTVTTSVDSQLTTFLDLMAERRWSVKKWCEQKAESATPHQFTIKTTPNTILARLIFNRERSLIWCPVFKAASTNWLNNFILLDVKASEVRHRFSSMYYLTTIALLLIVVAGIKDVL